MTRNTNQKSKPAREFTPPAYIAWHVDGKRSFPCAFSR